MLIQTKNAIKNLKACGIARKHFSVNTPFNNKYKGYDWANIILYHDKIYLKKSYIKKLIQFFDLTIIIQNKKMVNLFIYDTFIPEGAKGKIRKFNLDKNRFEDRKKTIRKNLQAIKSVTAILHPIQENKKDTKKLRKLKRNRLIKKLFYHLCDKSGLDYKGSIPVKIIIQDMYKIHQINSSFARSKLDFESPDFNILYQKMFLSMVSLKDKVKHGYSNDYYSGRHEKLNFVIGNRKKALLFVMYHEIYHFIQRRKYGIDFYDLSIYDRESQADNFAIAKIQEGENHE